MCACVDVRALVCVCLWELDGMETGGEGGQVEGGVQGEAL